MKRIIALIVVSVFGVGLIILGSVYYKYFRGAKVLWHKPIGDISVYFEIPTGTHVSTSSTNETNFPLNLPAGFSISIFAKNLPGARVMTIDPRGDMWVSRTSEGAVTMLDIENGKVISQNDIFTKLNRPHGLVFNGDLLYIAEENKISTFDYYQVKNSTAASNDYERVKMSQAVSSQSNALNKVIDLPKGGRHFTRTLGFGPDGKLYVSIGSTCDTCSEKDPRHATVYSLNKDGSDFKPFAVGLRNAVFFTWHPKTQKIWATEMGRDFLGDINPPDEINIVEEGKNYGWPECYGKNIQDTKFDPKNYVVNPCHEPDYISSHIDLVGHSAPLGLAFVPENSSWPKEYWNNLLVAYHGSWNKTKPTGYKIVRIKLDEQGNYLGTEDFISGWLTPKGVLGRPVDILIDKSGIMYVSDDSAGIIYKIISNS